MSHGKQYRAVFERDEDGWWVVSIPDVPGCHTQAKSIEQGLKRIREALSVSVEHSMRGVVITPEIKDPSIDTEIRHVRIMMERLREMEGEHHRALYDAVRSLLRAKYSLRDSAHLLGMSFQRVHQLAEESKKPKSRKTSDATATSSSR